MYYISSSVSYTYDIIDDDTKRFLITTNPKHKRPIVSSSSQPTERVSQFVDHHFPNTY